MSTIFIETTEPTRRFEVDLDKEPQEFALELKRVVSRLESRKSPKPSVSTKQLREKMKRASAYVDTIAERPQSKAAIAEADKLRIGWVRKYD